MSGTGRFVWAFCGLITVASKSRMVCFSLCDENHRPQVEVQVEAGSASNGKGNGSIQGGILHA